MFSTQQKQHISAAVEKVLLNINHPEMLTEKPSFHLHVDGVESWSWADIWPNWMYDDNNLPDVNAYNEAVATQMKRKARK